MVAKRNIQTTFTVPKELSAAQRKLVAQMIIEKIQENTSMGKNRYGGNFPKYSKAYKESLDFKNAGKTNLVNLELTGDMMASLEIINSSRIGEVTIGYKAGDAIAGQVEGVTIGSYGGSPNSEIARPFIGLPQKQLDLIIASVQTDTENELLTRNAVDSIVDNLLGRFF